MWGCELEEVLTEYHLRNADPSLLARGTGRSLATYIPGDYHARR